MRAAVYTLIDITATGVTNYSTDARARNQQRNWETVHQIINLRTQCPIEAVPASYKLVDMSSHEFGSFYLGQHRCWKFIFNTEYPAVLGTGHDPFERLRYDFNSVPVIIGLDETIHMPDPVFYLDGLLKNTYFKVLSQKD